MKITSNFNLELDENEFTVLSKFLGKSSEYSFRQTLEDKIPTIGNNQHDLEVATLLDITHKLLNFSDKLNRFS